MAVNSLHSFFRDSYGARGEQARLTPMAAIQEKKNPLAGLKPNWFYLLPVVGVVGLGCALIPYFAFGFGVGVELFVFSMVFSLLIEHCFPQLKRDRTKDDGMDEYVRYLAKSPVVTALVAPVIEEVLFRCALQPLLMLVFISIVPALALMPVFPVGLSLAAVAAIACTSIIFGLVHLSNSKKNDNYGQVINCIFDGVVLGTLAALFGPAAAIAAHIANNTICATILQLSMQLGSTEAAPADEVQDDSADCMPAPAC